MCGCVCGLCEVLALFEAWLVVHEFFMYCKKLPGVGAVFVIVLPLHLQLDNDINGLDSTCLHNCCEFVCMYNVCVGVSVCMCL